MTVSRKAESVPSRSQLPTRRKLRRTQEERSRGTQTKLLDAARKLLVERGYGHVTVDDISAAAGVTNGARVYHFGTKLELMISLWEQLGETLHQASTQALAKVSPDADPLDAFTDFHFRLAQDSSAIAFYELLNGARADAALNKRIHQTSKDHRDKAESAWLNYFCNRGYEAEDAVWIMRTTVCLLRGLFGDPFISSSPKRLRAALKFWCDRVIGPFAASIATKARSKSAGDSNIPAK